MENAIKLALEMGFSQAGLLDPATIELKEEVRQMCRNCGAYDTRWSCPPGCGSLEECRERLGAYHQGVLVQTTGQLEDPFDGEGMMGTEATHKENFTKLYELLRQRYPGMLWLGKLLYPEQADYDLYEAVAEHYKLFYHCDLTREQYDALVAESIGKQASQK